MNRQEVLKGISEAIANFDIPNAGALCKTAIGMGIQPYDIVIGGMSIGMDLVRKRYEKGDYFLSELIMAGETMKEAMRVIEPYLMSQGSERRGTVVVGTVQGDLHDIGKNIFANLLRGAGFRVIDLGYDVSPESFADEVARSKPDILGMSALVTTTITSMGETVAELKRRSIRHTVKIIIGGTPITPSFAREIDADAYARDAVEGLSICKRWTIQKQIL